MEKVWVLSGVVFALLGVLMGAFGAHSLSKVFDEKAMEVYQTATQYLMYHSLGLILFGIWSQVNSFKGSFTGWAFVSGAVIFSGSLYLLAITGVKWLGAITPIGGVLFILAWLSWAWTLLK